MSRLKPYKFRDLIKKLRKFDQRFEAWSNRGKGSHRMIYHPDVDGRPVSYPVMCHGRGQEIDKNYVRDLIRAFKLPDGVL